jgi:hypothetical protein
MNYLELIVNAAFAAATGWRSFVMFKNAYEIRKVMYAGTSKEIKTTFWRQIGAGALYLIAALYFINEVIKNLTHLSAPH